MTQDELLALPLASSFEYEIRTDPVTGDTIHIRLPTRLHMAGVRQDDIAVWSDDTGTWTPVYMGEDIGWAKEPMMVN